MENEEIGDVLDRVDNMDYESDEDDDFLEFNVIIAFPRRARIFRNRPDHFKGWTEDEFLQKFRLNKNTVRFLVEILDERLAPISTR